jgi:hypothetical protein
VYEEKRAVSYFRLGSSLQSRRQIASRKDHSSLKSISWLGFRVNGAESGLRATPTLQHRHADVEVIQSRSQAARQLEGTSCTPAVLHSGQRGRLQPLGPTHPLPRVVTQTFINDARNIRAINEAYADMKMGPYPCHVDAHTRTCTCSDTYTTWMQCNSCAQFKCVNMHTETNKATLHNQVLRRSQLHRQCV